MGKPVPQSRNEAAFRIYLTEKTNRLLSPKVKTMIEDYAWELLTKYHRDITRADADKPFWEFSSSENHYVNNRRRYTQTLQIARMSDRYGPNHRLGDETIESHYQAWTAFWIRYFQARAAEGTDMEIGHPSSYGVCTVGVYYDLYDLTDSPRLRELAGKFLTLYWAEIAAEFEYANGKLTYESEANDSYEYWAKGAQPPKINGTTVNLNPTKTYDSPYLSVEHGQSKAVISCPSFEDVVLEFSNPKP